MPELREVAIHNGHPGLEFSEKQVIRCFRLLDSSEEYSIPRGELSIAFLTDEDLAGLHRVFLDDPAPTDVITFPGSAPGDHPGGGYAGEICISADTAQAASLEYSLPFHEEMTLYLIHGWLHLAGLGDKSPEDSRRMRHAEQKLLSHLREHNGIPSFTLQG